MIVRKLNQVVRAARRLGLPWLAYRGWKAIADKSGLTRQRLPVVDLFQLGLEKVASVDEWRGAAHFFDYRQQLGTRFLWDRIPERSEFVPFDSSQEEFVETIDRLQHGQFRYFSSTLHEMGNPPNWFRNPYFDTIGPSEVHFSQLGDFQYGDIKAIWELSRFGFVFELARAYARLRDPRCGQLFWSWFEEWCRQNPVNQGVNWKCGQETALRAIAITFGAWVFGDTEAATTARLALLSKLMHHSALRIEKYISYALHQNNNHSISEAAGLFAIGLLYPELDRANHWRSLGLRLLEQEIERLFFKDGGFVQYSGNYQRMAMQLLTFCFQLARRNDIHISASTRTRAEASIGNMAQWVDVNSGGAPRFGNDDGSLLFPLSHCSYEDYRPALQASAGCVFGHRIFDSGPWDEEMLWMGLDARTLPIVPSNPSDMVGSEGGISVLQGRNGRAVFRCGRNHFRPAQLDLFHVDLWHQGRNIALDPGTYSYNGTGAFAGTPFAEARYHNTVRLNCREPADRIGVFLFDPWPSGKLVGLHRSSDERIGLLLGERLDRFVADKQVLHRRAIVGLDRMGWMVVDEITCDDPIPNQLHWLLDASYFQKESAASLLLYSEPLQNYLTLAAQGGIHRSKIECGTAGSPDGWFASRYLSLQPSVSVSVETVPTSKTHFFSVFAPEPVEFVFPTDSSSHLRCEWTLGYVDLHLGNDASELLTCVKLALDDFSSELSL